MKEKMDIDRTSRSIHIITFVLAFLLLVLLVFSSISIFYLLEVHAQQQETDESSTTSNTTRNLPQALLVDDNTMGVTQLPLRSYTIDGEPISGFTSSEPGHGKLSNYFPIVLFRFKTQTVGFEEGVSILKHLLMGPIKSYDSADIVTNEANYWKDIPLNERVALEIDSPGPHYLIASVQFANGTSGIYSGIMDVNAVGIKPSSYDSIQFQLDGVNSASGVVKMEQSDVAESETDQVFQQIASRIVCSDLSDNGFEVCENGDEDVVLEEDNENENDDNDDNNSNERNSDEDNRDEVRGDGGKDGQYDKNNCSNEQCEDADRETQQEKEGDYCEIDPSYCKDKANNDDNKEGDEVRDTKK